MKETIAMHRVEKKISDIFVFWFFIAQFLKMGNPSITQIVIARHSIFIGFVSSALKWPLMIQVWSRTKPSLKSDKNYFLIIVHAWPFSEITGALSH